MVTLGSVKEVIEAVGGPAAACSLAQVPSSNAPSNWIKRRKIPSEYFLVFAEVLNATGKEADPSVFGLKQPAEARP